MAVTNYAAGRAPMRRISAFDGPLHEPFGRLRTALPGNRADVEFIYDKQPLLIDDISANSGTATHNANARDVVLAVGGTETNRVAGLRGHYWAPYTPGNGGLIEITGTADNAGLGGGTMYTFIRTTVSGSTVLNKTAQTSWTEDGITNADWSKSQIFGIDFQSLKVGTIRYFLVRNGDDIVIVNVVHNDNVRATGFWQAPSLPLYWKLYNDSTVTSTVFEIGYGDDANGVGFRYEFDGYQATATSRAICGTVKSEGGVNLLDLAGFPFSAGTGAAGAVTVSTTLIPLASVRVAPTFNSITNRGLSIPTAYQINTDNPIYYQVIYRPSLTGASFASVNGTASHMQIDTSASAITGGFVVDEGFLASGPGNRSAETRGLLGRVIMSQGSTGTSDILSIAAIRESASDAAVDAVFKWEEIR